MLLGAFLVVAEIIFIPGIFVAGSIGALCSFFGIYYAYSQYGQTAGTIVLVLTVIGNVLAVYLSLRGKSWEKISLRESHTSKVNEGLLHQLQVGDEGISMSVIKPVGKALFGEQVVEVRSKGLYITENQPIRVIKIENDQVFVATLK